MRQWSNPVATLRGAWNLARLDAMTQQPLTTWHWKRSDYERLVDLGLFQGKPVELIGGELLVAEPQGSYHATGISVADEALRAILPSGWYVRAQMPVALDEESEPEPDLAVVSGTGSSISSIASWRSTGILGLTRSRSMAGATRQPRSSGRRTPSPCSRFPPRGSRSARSCLSTAPGRRPARGHPGTAPAPSRSSCAPPPA
jgi:Putative restriction endonuclease